MNETVEKVSSEFKMKYLCKTVREAFYFDREEAASRSLAYLLFIRYRYEYRYRALVNLRLSQLFYARFRRASKILKEKKQTSNLLLLTLAHPLKSASTIFYYRLYKYVWNYNLTKYQININPQADVGNNLWGTLNNIGITLHTRIGKNARLDRFVEIAPDETTGRAPVIGDNVTMHTGAVIVGVTVGDNAVIGANSLVLESVPPNATVLGVPAKVRFKTKPKQK